MVVLGGQQYLVLTGLCISSLVALLGIVVACLLLFLAPNMTIFAFFVKDSFVHLLIFSKLDPNRLIGILLAFKVILAFLRVLVVLG